MRKDSLQQRQEEMRQRWGDPPGPGRPRLEIDPEKVFELALLGYSNAEIARQISCDRKTLKRFAAVLERARARHMAPLKLREFRAAIAEGNPAALRRCLKQLTKDQLRSRQVATAAKQRGEAEMRTESRAPAAAQRCVAEPHQPAAPVPPTASRVDAAGPGICPADSTKIKSPSSQAKPQPPDKREQAAKPQPTAKPERPAKSDGWIFMELI